MKYYFFKLECARGAGMAVTKKLWLPCEAVVLLWKRQLRFASRPEDKSGASIC